jgi:hypothetical protein
MNERIRQLADEAGLRFTQLMSNPMVPVVDGKETDLEKFAELIVRECAGIGEQYADGNYEVPNQILEYFGMQEPEE